MKRKAILQKALSIGLLAGMVLSLVPTTVKADNPIVQTYYTCDPAPVVFNDTVYLYTTHDEDVIIGDDNMSDFFTMHNWKCFSSKDMVNWTDHGTVMGNFTFDWGTRRAWAGQCMEYNGKYYFFVPLVKNDGSGYGIGIGVSDTPEGPFEDYLGRPVVEGNWTDIDPTVYNDDGQVYLYFGQTLKYVKLNENLTDYDHTIGNKGLVDVKGIDSYVEGPWFYKRGEQYYMVYAGRGANGEDIRYSMSDGPTGPWKNMGEIIDTESGPVKGEKIGTIHPGVIDYKDKSYIFYHDGDLPGGYSFHRSVCADEFEYNADGTIDPRKWTVEGLKAVDTLDPYQKVEAETICWERGVKTGHPKDMSQSYITDEIHTKYPELERHYFDGVFITNDQGKYDVDVYNMHDGDYIKVKNVDFGTDGAVKFNARVKDVKADANASIDIYVKDANEEVSKEKTLESLGLTDDDKMGNIQIENGITGYKELSTKLDKKITGTHDLYFVFRGDYEIPQREIDYDFMKSHEAYVGEEDIGMFHFDSWSFEKEQLPTQVPYTPTAVPTVPTAAPTVAPATSAPIVAPATTAPKTLTIGKAALASLKNIKPKSLVIKIKKVTNAKGYEVTIARNSKFTKSKNVKVIKTTSLKFRKLKKGSTYYVKCRAYGVDSTGKKVFGKFSKISKIKIKK